MSKVFGITEQTAARPDTAGMPLIRLADPSPGENYTRTPLPVRVHGDTRAYAVFRDGAYEIHVDTITNEELDEGATELTFEMREGHPVGIRLGRKRE